MKKEGDEAKLQALAVPVMSTAITARKLLLKTLSAHHFNVNEKESSVVKTASVGCSNEIGVEKKDAFPKKIERSSAVSKTKKKNKLESVSCSNEIGVDKTITYRENGRSSFDVQKGQQRNKASSVDFSNKVTVRVRNSRPLKKSDDHQLLRKGKKEATRERWLFQSKSSIRISVKETTEGTSCSTASPRDSSSLKTEKNYQGKGSSKRSPFTYTYYHKGCETEGGRTAV